MAIKHFLCLLSGLTFLLACSTEGKTMQESQEDMQREVRIITPPNLDQDHLGKKILCHRPMRRGSPQMSVQKIEDKIVAHNYGHGGSGWTLGPGTASYVNGLLESSEYSNLTKETPITIIGAGAIGLFTAYDLVDKGYTDITIVAKKFDDLTSHNAGGLLAPVSMDNEPDMQKIIDEIGINAYRFYAAIAQKEHTILKEGSVIVPTYFRTRSESGLEPYVGKVMQPAKDVLLDFNNGTTQKMVSYDDGIFIDTGILMESLINCLRPKLRFVQKEIKDFSEIETQYIINCTGLGGKELNKDDEMISVQGHLIMLKDQKAEDLQHMILVYFNERQTASGQKIKPSLYMFPKRLPGSGENDVGVIGGTFIEGATPETPNEEEFALMMEGARNFYGIE